MGCCLCRTGGVAVSYVSEVLADNPTAYWHVDETTGTTITDAIGGITLTANGAPQLSRTSLVGGGSMYIGDSASSYGTSAGIDGMRWLLNTDLSIEFLHRRGSINTSTTGILGHRTNSSSNRHYSLFYIGNVLIFDVGVNGAGAMRWTTTSAASDTYWHHYVFTHEGATGNRVLWMDGLRVESATGLKPPAADPTAGTLRLGGPVVGNSTVGWLDEVAIYNGAVLPDVRVKSHWRELLNVNTKPFLMTSL